MEQRFYVDDFFNIGQAHLGLGKPCQDYSFSGVAGDGAFAVVSDGCSSGRHTDVGARIIALSTADALQQWLNHPDTPFNELNRLVTRRHNDALLKSGELFNLQLSDMLATCLYVCLTPGGGLISVQGDGVVVKVYRNGSFTLTAYQWDNNTPLYPAYVADNYKSFIRAHGGDPNSVSLKRESYYQDIYGDMWVSLQDIPIDKAIQGLTQEIFEKEIAELAFVAVFTDGVTQVDGMCWKDAVSELLAFKNVNGEFAKRRMIRFIKDSKAGNKKGPLDDMSYAVIRVNREESGEASDGQ